MAKNANKNGANNYKTNANSMSNTTQGMNDYSSKTNSSNMTNCKSTINAKGKTSRSENVTDCK